MSFQSDLEFGNLVQEKIISFLERYWNLEFVAGERNGETVGINKIEEIFNCKFIPTKQYFHGAMLEFIDYQNEENVRFIMPDELFIHKKTMNYVWVESKGRHSGKMYEKKKKIEQYRKVKQYSKSTVYIIFAVEIQNSGSFDLYSSPIDSVQEEFEYNGETYYLYNQDNMKKLNKYPV